MALFARKKAEINIEVNSDKALADQIIKQFRAGVSYKRSQGYYDKWAEYQRFWEADQWPQATEDTKTLPRPVTNHFAEIIEQKIAAITYEAPEMYFEPQEQDASQTTDDEAAYLLSQVAINQAARLDFDRLLEEGVRDAALLCNGIWYFPWDNSIVGGTPGVSAYIGDIAGYVIDPADFFPGDPTNPDIQSQPWIILAERRPLNEVKEFYKEYAPEIVNLLQPERQTSDTLVYDHQRVEQDETGYVDVYHRWWKEKKGYKKQLHYAVVCQGQLLRHEEELYKHGLYPFVAFQWYPRRKSFFGKPESADLINNQKEHNRLDGMMLLSAYNTAMPQKRIKEQFVDERDVTNDPGTVIKDRSPVGGWGVDYLQSPSMPAYPAQMRDSLAQGMRDVSGAHEAWIGKAPSADLNASAILALQEAAGVRIRSIQRRLYRAIREIGLLWLAYWKEFYTEARLIRIAGPNNEIGFRWFRGTDYADMQFDIKVKANSTSPYSKALYMANLDKMLQSGVITPEEYLEMLPEDVFPKAQELLARRMEARQQQMMQQQQQMIQQPPLPAALPLQGGVFGGEEGVAQNL
jgi:hypothetical protein